MSNEQNYRKAKAFLMTLQPKVVSSDQIKIIKYSNDDFLVREKQDKRPSGDNKGLKVEPARIELPKKDFEASTSFSMPAISTQYSMRIEEQVGSKNILKDQKSRRPKVYESDPNVEARQEKSILKKLKKRQNSENLGRNYRIGDLKEWSAEPTVSDQKIYYILRNKFGLKQFRNNQKAIIKCTLANNDIFVCMPTGGGKSLTFQLPLAYKPGLTICVLPLISLIYDQEILSKRLKLNAYCITGNTSQSEQKQFFQELLSLDQKQEGVIVFTTPQKLLSSQRIMKEFQSVYYRGLLSRIVIDEVHCVSTWGRDFREDYANLGYLKKKFPNTPLLALTATATQQVKTDAIEKLGIANCYYFQSSFNRPNLFYSVRPKTANLTKDIIDICNKYKNQTGIVYCLSKKQCQKLAQILQKTKIKAAFYHADVKAERKKEIQDKWMSDQIKIIVATIAFGMGINKPDVRFVIHHTMSKSLQNYYQQSGRAGRDGQAAECILFYRRSDCSTLSSFNMNNDFSTKQSKDFNQRSLSEMIRYGEEKFECRRVLQMNYLGQKFTKEQCGKTCDNCQIQRKFKQIPCFDGVVELVDFIQNVNSNKEALTISQLVLFLTGQITNKKLGQKVQFFNKKGIDFSSLEFFRKWKKDHVELLIMSLVIEGVLKECTTSHNKFSYTEIKVNQNNWRQFKKDRTDFGLKVQDTKISKIEEEFDWDAMSQLEQDDLPGITQINFDEYACSKATDKSRTSGQYDQLLQMLDYNENILNKYKGNSTNKEHSFDEYVCKKTKSRKESSDDDQLLQLLQGDMRNKLKNQKKEPDRQSTKEATKQIPSSACNQDLLDFLDQLYDA